jgi:hypothetical protein
MVALVNGNVSGSPYDTPIKIVVNHRSSRTTDISSRLAFDSMESFRRFTIR